MDDGPAIDKPILETGPIGFSLYDNRALSILHACTPTVFTSLGNQSRMPGIGARAIAT